MAGDLNDTAWSRTTRLFLQVSGLLDPRIGRSPVNTFHADYRLLRWPLDHVFVSPHFRLIRFQRMSHIGSDHFPVFAELELETLNPGSELERSEDIDRELELDTRDTAVANDRENSLMQDSGETTSPEPTVIVRMREAWCQEARTCVRARVMTTESPGQHRKVMPAVFSCT